MVAVCDQSLPVSKIGFDLCHRCGIGQPPDPVFCAVSRLGSNDGLGQQRSVDRSARRTAAAVGQQDRLELGAGGGHELGAIRHQVRKDVLMREHHVLGRIVQ